MKNIKNIYNIILKNVEFINKYKHYENFYIYEDFILDMTFLYLDLFDKKIKNNEYKSMINKYKEHINILKCSFDNKEMNDCFLNIFCLKFNIMNDLIFYIFEVDDTYTNNINIKNKMYRTKYINEGHYFLIINTYKKEAQIIDLRLNKNWFFENNREKEEKEINYIKSIIQICKKDLPLINKIFIFDNNNIFYDKQIFNFSDIYSFYDNENKTWYEKYFNFVVSSNINESENNNKLIIGQETYILNEANELSKNVLEDTYNFNNNNHLKYIYFM